MRSRKSALYHHAWYSNDCRSDPSTRFQSHLPHAASVLCLSREFRALSCDAVWEQLVEVLRHVKGRLTWSSCKANVALQLGQRPTPVFLSTVEHHIQLPPPAPGRPAPLLCVTLIWFVLRNRVSVFDARTAGVTRVMKKFPRLHPAATGRNYALRIQTS